MRLDFYYTAKRINALTRPDVDESQVIVTTFTDFHIKDQTDLNNPCFVIISGNLPETNYCILSNTGATSERPDKYYYFVNRIEQVRKTMWNIYCTIDALATWKPYILQQSAFVMRSGNYVNPYIIDTALPTKNEITHRNCFSYINTDIALSTSQGCVIFACAMSGADIALPGTIGGVTHVCMRISAFQSFTTTLYQSGVAQQLKDTFGNMAAAIMGAYWIPISYDDVPGTTVSTIFIGGFSASVSGKIINSNFYRKNYNGTASLTHYGDFRDNPPFRSYYMEFPWVGLVDVDSDKIAAMNRLTSNGSIGMFTETYYDFLSGVIMYRVFIGRSSAEILLCEISGSAKVDLPISAFKANIAGLIGGVLEKVGGAIGTATPTSPGTSDYVSTTNPLLNLFAAANPKPVEESGIGKTLLDLGTAINMHSGGTTSIVGGYSGTAMGGINPLMSLYEKAQDTSVPPSNVNGVMGRPYYGVLSLGSCAGYTHTNGFAVKGKMTTEEKSIIENAFNGSGVFITE